MATTQHPDSSESTEWERLPSSDSAPHNVLKTLEDSNQEHDISGKQYLHESTFTTNQGISPQGQSHGHHMPTSPVHATEASCMIATPPSVALQSWLDSLVITSSAPSSAQGGSPINVYFRATGAPRTLDPVYFYIAFQDTLIPARLTKLSQTGHQSHYMLSVQVPSVNPCPWSQAVDLSMILQDEDGTTLAERRAGQFSFLDRPDIGSYAAKTTYGKRRASLEPQALQSTTKRLRSDIPLDHRQGTWARVPTPPSSHNLTLFKNISDINCGVRLAQETGSQAYITPQTTQKTLQPSHTSANPFQSGGIPMTRSVSAYDGYFPATPQYSSPLMFNTRMSPLSRLALPSKPFYGTSPTLSAATMRRPSGSISPLSNDTCPPTTTSRPILSIQGDLASILHEWNEEEDTVKRRLVVFERQQTNTTLTVSFRVVSTEHHSPGSICVSCIWWDEKNTAFITSVDAIAVIEALCGYKFNVPVKNRIRRNMEGFKPITVTKDKEDTESFFKVIMGFTNPKPRNIEKHIKVFPWSSLSAALRKIVSKYARNPTAALNRSVAVRKLPVRRFYTPGGDVLGTFGEDMGYPPPSPASAPSSYGTYVAYTTSGQRVSQGSIPPGSYSPAHAQADVDHSSHGKHHTGIYSIVPAPTLPTFPVEDPQTWQPWQLQVSAPNQYRAFDTPPYTDWNLSSLFDSDLTAIPSSVQANPQTTIYDGLGVLPDYQNNQYDYYTSELELLQSQYNEDQPIDTGKS